MSERWVLWGVEEIKISIGMLCDYISLIQGFFGFSQDCISSTSTAALIPVPGSIVPDLQKNEDHCIFVSFGAEKVLVRDQMTCFSFRLIEMCIRERMTGKYR